MERIKFKRKNIGRLILVCLGLFLFLHVSGQSVKRDVLQHSYTKEIGTRELTGHNDGTKVESYLAVTGLDKGYPWCAAFLAWNFKQVGIVTPRSAYSPDWFAKKENVIYKKSWQKLDYKSKVGQVFGLYFENKGRVAHVGFIDGEDANNYYTVEGNTNSAGSREGDGVCRKIRSKKSVYIIADYIK